MEPAAVVTLIAVVLVIVALVVYLVAVILELRKITAGLDAVITSVGGIVSKSEPVNGVVVAINRDLSAGTDLLEGLLDKKAGQDDAAGLVESLYPGSGASVLARQGRSGEVKNIGEVYTRGAVQLARLGRESPLGAGAMSGAALRDATYSSAAARSIYTNPSGPVADEPGGPRHRPRSPVIGTEAGADGGPQSDEPRASDG
ncbi:MAG TPA: hypothetical protein VLB79_14695 [Solirubrobacterales bacterium]|nr:hypothetical protein [Solirubrobacterales bacterium]